jgi:hypothetical protein
MNNVLLSPSDWIILHEFSVAHGGKGHDSTESHHLLTADELEVLQNVNGFVRFTMELSLDTLFNPVGSVIAHITRNAFAPGIKMFNASFEATELKAGGQILAIEITCAWAE